MSGILILLLLYVAPLLPSLAAAYFVPASRPGLRYAVCVALFGLVAPAFPRVLGVPPMPWPSLLVIGGENDWQRVAAEPLAHLVSLLVTLAIGALLFAWPYYRTRRALR